MLRILTLISGGLLAACQSLAAGAQYYVVPLKGLTGITPSALQAANSKKESKYSGMIDEVYADLFFDNTSQKALFDQFSQIIASAYPTSVISPAQVNSGGSKPVNYVYEPDAYPCGKNFNVGYQRVYAASLGVSRLSVYLNDYGDKTQVLIPITYTVRFVKMDGASVVYSKSETVNTTFDFGKREFYVPGSGNKTISPTIIKQIKEAVIKDGMASARRIVDIAVKSFSPRKTPVTMVAREGNYFLFDRGSESGFKSGHPFEATQAGTEGEYSFVIKYATEKIAIGVAANDPNALNPSRLRGGTKLDFTVETQGVDDAKMSVLVSQYVAKGEEKLQPALVRTNALATILADDLGFSAPINLVKQDPDFVVLKNQIRSEINCESGMYARINGFADDSTTPRATPDLILKLDFFSSPTTKSAGVGGVTVNTAFSDSVSLSLVDISGVVRQNFLGTNNYLLSVTDSKGLSVDQAREISLKNAGLIAMKDLVQKFSPKKKIIKIVSMSNGVATLDGKISPSVFKQFKLYRPVRFGNATYFIPNLPKDENFVLFTPPDDVTDKLNYRGGLQVGDTLIQPFSDEGINPIQLCQRNTNFMLTKEVLNSPSGVVLAMHYAVGSESKSYDLVETNADFVFGVNTALSEGKFSTTQFVPAGPINRCILPIEMQQATNFSCSNKKCSGSANIASGIRVFEGNSKIEESIAGGTLEFKDINESEVAGFVGLKAYEQHLKSIPNHKLKIK
jgi:hypothetical protein